MKVNTDGASKSNPREASTGCVIRDHNGDWRVRAAQNLGIATSVTAENGYGTEDTKM